MRKKILAMCLALALLLSGCGLGDYWVDYEDMEYVRPDMAGFDQTLLDSCETVMSAEDLDQVLDAIYDFYWVYDDFYTAYSLAFIRYSGDLTDIYWEQEYNYCAGQTATVDAGLQQLYETLADCPFREELEGEDYFGEGYFEYYDGESLWDEEFVALMEEETALVGEYYTLSEEALAVEPYSEEFYETYGTRMGELYVELVKLRQEIAAYAGYDSYVDFAYDFYYYRDYTPAQAQSLLADIQRELAPMYRELAASHVWDLGYELCTEAQAMDYVRRCAENMGGTVEEAFGLLESAGLYDIAWSENKYDASFEVFLNSYYEPFIFMKPYGTVYDQLTLAHEFGHFANDYACGGSYAGVDVMEVFSQGMEYLSLCYGEDTRDLEQLKMADCLSVYVEQTAYASFEQQVYGLTGADLTVENIYGLYERVCRDFGLDSVRLDGRDFVTITHFFTDPMYIVSYVVSNDAAFQLYQLEKGEKGAGLAVFEDNLDTGEAYFLAFLDAAGLESPFVPGHMEQVRMTLEEIL